MATTRYQPPEHDVVQVEGILDDAGGGDAGAEDVLLAGQVVRCAAAVTVGQKTGARRADSTVLSWQCRQAARDPTYPAPTFYTHTYICYHLL